MAGSINKVILVGRLGKDPQLTYLPSGNPVANFSVATDESYKDRDGNKVERTEWHNVAVYGRSAEFCGQYLAKGRLVYIEGTLRTRAWEKDGEKRYTTEVVVTAPGHTVQGLDSNRQDQPQQPQQPRQASGGRGRQDENPHGPAFPSEASGMDDVPFALILAPLAALAMAAMQGGWLA